jgi:hypothetical protein
MKWSGAAPCQCHWLSAMVTTSPGRIFDDGLAAGLDQSFAFGDLKRLGDRVPVPGGAGAGGEVHVAE